MHRRQQGSGLHAAREISIDAWFRAAASSDRPQVDTIDGTSGRAAKTRFHAPQPMTRGDLRPILEP